MSQERRGEGSKQPQMEKNLVPWPCGLCRCQSAARLTSCRMRTLHSEMCACQCFIFLPFLVRDGLKPQVVMAMLFALSQMLYWGIDHLWRETHGGNTIKGSLGLKLSLESRDSKK